MTSRGQWYYFPCQKARGDEAQRSTTGGVLEKKRLLRGPLAPIKHVTRWPEAHMLVLMGPMRWVQPMAASHSGTSIHGP